MNLENPLHLLYITMPFDLPNMTIGFRQLVDRVSIRLKYFIIIFELLISIQIKFSFINSFFSHLGARNEK